jgi:hypothetical protein
MSAESAIHPVFHGIKHESRFQRSYLGFYKSWGDAPGSILNTAPLALNTNRSWELPFSAAQQTGSISGSGAGETG